MLRTAVTVVVSFSAPAGACSGPGGNSPNVSEDPSPGGSSLKAARSEGLTLYCDHFLLFSAAVSGQAAVRNVMIPCLVECLENLSIQECMSDACKLARNKIGNYLAEKYPKHDQVPLVMETLRCKLCISKTFPSLPQTSTNSAIAAANDSPSETGKTS